VFFWWWGKAKRNEVGVGIQRTDFIFSANLLREVVFMVFIEGLQ